MEGVKLSPKAVSTASGVPPTITLYFLISGRGLGAPILAVDVPCSITVTKLINLIIKNFPETFEGMSSISIELFDARHLPLVDQTTRMPTELAENLASEHIPERLRNLCFVKKHLLAHISCVSDYFTKVDNERKYIVHILINIRHTSMKRKSDEVFPEHSDKAQNTGKFFEVSPIRTTPGVSSDPDKINLRFLITGRGLSPQSSKVNALYSMDVEDLKKLIILEHPWSFKGIGPENLELFYAHHLDLMDRTTLNHIPTETAQNLASRCIPEYLQNECFVNQHLMGNGTRIRDCFPMKDNADAYMVHFLIKILPTGKKTKFVELFPDDYDKVKKTVKFVNVATIHGVHEEVYEEFTLVEKEFKFLTVKGYLPMESTDECAKTIFIRPCYEAFFDLLLRYIHERTKMKVIITGNPGIGTSRLYQYCAYRLISEKLTHRKVIVSHKKLCERYDNGFFYELSEDEIQDMRGDPNVVLLVDAEFTWLLPSWAGVSILFASPGGANYRQFAKESCIRHVMPVWSLEELTIANSFLKALTPEHLVQRYEYLGGIARYVFAPPKYYPNYENEIIQTLSSPELLKWLNHVAAMTAVDEKQYSHKLLHMVPSHIPKTLDEISEIPLDRPLFMEHHLDFASYLIQVNVVNRLAEQTDAKLNDIVIATSGNEASAVLHGHLFDIKCHRLFTLDSEAVHTLHGNTLEDRRTAFRLNICAGMKITKISTIKDIPVTNLSGAAYYRPKWKNFPAVDAIYWDGITWYLLRMTIADDHGILHKAICDYLGHLTGGNNGAAFVFVVPEAKVKDFKAQRFVTPHRAVSGLKQYVVGVEFPLWSGNG